MNIHEVLAQVDYSQPHETILEQIKPYKASFLDFAVVMFAAVPLQLNQGFASFTETMRKLPEAIKGENGVVMERDNLKHLNQTILVGGILMYL